VKNPKLIGRASVAGAGSWKSGYLWPRGVIDLLKRASAPALKVGAELFLNSFRGSKEPLFHGLASSHGRGGTAGPSTSQSVRWRTFSFARDDRFF
jgi:hypothetical protein